MSIETWKWDGLEIKPKLGTPSWVMEAYEHGKISSICDRKTGEKRLIVHTKYGAMIGKVGCNIMRLDFTRFLVLDEEDRNALIR